MSLVEKSEIVSLAPLDRAGLQVLVCPYVEDAAACRDIGLNVIPVSWTGDYRLVDWSALAGRKVIVWENNDVDGAVRMSEIAGRIKMVGPTYVKIVRRSGSDRPWDWSIKDAVMNDGWEASDIVGFAKARAVDWTVQYHAERITERASADATPLELVEEA